MIFVLLTKHVTDNKVVEIKSDMETKMEHLGRYNRLGVS